MNKNLLALLASILVFAVVIAYVFKDEQKNCLPQQDYMDNSFPDTVSPDREIIPEQKIEKELHIKGKIYTYAEGYELSKKTKIPMFIVFGASWCAPCRQFENTLHSQEGKKTLENYIIIHVNVDNEREVVQKYGIAGKGIPNYMIVDHSNRKIREGSGYLNPMQLRAWLNNERPQSPPRQFQQPQKGG